MVGKMMMIPVPAVGYSGVGFFVAKLSRKFDVVRSDFCLLDQAAQSSMRWVCYPSISACGGLTVNVTSSNPALSPLSWTQGHCIWSQSATKLWYSYQNSDQTYCCCVPCGFFLLRNCSVFPALPKTRHSNHARSKEWFWWLNTDRLKYGWTNDGANSYWNRLSYHSDHSADCLACSGPQVIHFLNSAFLWPTFFKGPQKSPRKSIGLLWSDLSLLQKCH